MKPFLDEEFLLSTPAARTLYHQYAAIVPIIDYHCHIAPEEIARDRRYNNLTEVWLEADHYKWRLMRSCGIAENEITGDADPYDKFLAFAKVLPRAIGNPIYHWTHLELKRYFGCELPLSERTAPEIWAQCNEKLRDGLTVRAIIRLSNVRGIATTDDPLDTLEWHELIAADAGFDGTVKPAWRPDKLVNIDKPGFADYMVRFGAPQTMAQLRERILERMDHFDRHGCGSSDHGIESLVRVEASERELDAALQKGLCGEALTREEALAYQYALLRFMAEEYEKRGWVMEIHYGASRNNNTVFYDRLGPDSGFDAIAPAADISGLPRFLDELYQNGALPKTVLFSLNPNDNAMLNALCGCYQREGVAGAVQQGSAWWFSDTRLGMERQLKSMAELAPLANFVGMVTDSRSFLSYTRHEYFRRILCDLLGGWVENGEYPDDLQTLGAMVQDICYNNVKAFFHY